MQVTICIPARLNSSRFPKKILADLCGKSVLQHVFDRTRTCRGVNNIFILTDSDEAKDVATNFGAQVIETSDKCVSGTERIVSVLDKLPGDFIINIQGDEPFFDIEIIDRMLTKAAVSDADIFTPIFKFENMEDVADPNCVKVIINYAGRALYFSRSIVPYVRDEKDVSKWMKHADYYGHIGIYGYRRAVLERYHDMVKGKLEFIEKLEQLRFLENGFLIDTVETSNRTIGIDTPEDLERARNLLQR
ncbi:MAG: 3-deoxy-manno-octulosonate cytidylyltransferase [Opitutales bacterium]|nr:3-deoxy-manno-octulosonate cytidylyltransferase [Opitutales bacterium]